MQSTPFPDFADIPARRLAYGASLLVIAFMLMTLLTQVELKKDVAVDIIAPGDVKVQRVAGLVTKVHVQANAQVAKGTPLFEVERDLSLSQDGMTRADAMLREHALRLADIEQRVAVQRRDLQARIANFNRTLANRREAQAHNEREIVQARQQVGEGEKTLARLQSVAQYVEADRIERASGDLASRRSNLSQRLTRRAELASEVNTTQSSAREAQAELDKLEIQGRRDRHDAQEAFEKNRSTIVVSSPVAGVLSFSQVMPGKYLREEDIAMAISPNGQRALLAALRIPSRQRGFIKQGQQVRLKFDAFPYSRFGTYAVQLERISRDTVATARPSQEDPRGQGEEYVAYASLPQPYFTARGEQHQILPGMRATAAVVVEKRSIAEWIMPQLFEAIRG